MRVGVSTISCEIITLISDHALVVLSFSEIEDKIMITRVMPIDVSAQLIHLFSARVRHVSQSPQVRE